MRIFGEKYLMYLLKEKENCIRSEIENINEDYLLNVNEQEYIDYIKNKFYIEGLEINWDEACYHEHEELVKDKDRFSERIIDCKISIITIEVPFRGNKMLFQYEPNPSISHGIDVKLTDNTMSFKILLRRIEDAENVNKKYQDNRDTINKQLMNINKNINDFNKNIAEVATKLFKSRKEKVLLKRKSLMKINIPLKLNNDACKTFSIPPINVKKSISVKRPVVTTENYKPEPTLDESMYMEILKLINNGGKLFERYPSTSKGKGEEALRDYLLFLLQPNFEGSATGETFNYTGKTDILLRYENSNVFIGECKFWKGEKGYLATIDQLLNYLTWRDSKVAVIIFVKKHEFTGVLKKIKEATPKHSNYISYKGDSDETWFNYLFHLNGDKDRNVHLAVMVYNIPD